MDAAQLQRVAEPDRIDKVVKELNLIEDDIVRGGHVSLTTDGGKIANAAKRAILAEAITQSSVVGKNPMQNNGLHFVEKFCFSLLLLG